jgi:hypothetical protein
MTRNLPKHQYVGEFNYNGYLWKGTTEARSEEHAFSKLVVGLAKACNTTSYFARNYFLSRPVRYEIRRVRQ